MISLAYVKAEFLGVRVGKRQGKIKVGSSDQKVKFKFRCDSTAGA